MYEKKQAGWRKHMDFLIIDMISQQSAVILSYYTYFGSARPYLDAEYLNLSFILAIIDFCVALAFESFSKVLKRGYYKEFAAVVRHVLLVEGFAFVYLFMVQRSNIYPRAFVFSTIPLHMALTYVGRLLRKKGLKRAGSRGSGRSLIIMAPEDRIGECIDNTCKTDYNAYSFVGAVVTDADRRGTAIKNVPVVAASDNALNYIQKEWVDEVFISSSLEEGYPAELLDQLKRMGVVVHIPVTKAGSIMENTQQIERFGNYTVLTTGVNCATSMQLWLKRLMDIAGGAAGCLATAFLFVFLAPAIYISSPGPIFFAQERVGRNGKKFKMYKFRTMYPDADKRKKELMAQNRVAGGLMFKLDDDPRIIGSKKLADGTVKKGIGGFLRETSLDELPQAFNILRGDMSLVGTRPPTVDEWEQYDLHHRARLSFRPGLTGLWQISGRSCITDFEEVVRLDTKYIDEWTLGLDIKILLKTIGVVLRGRGAM